MSKRLSLFMVAVMAMLFTAPVQAQNAVKEMKKATKTFKATPTLNESQKAKMLDAWKQKMDQQAKASASQDAGTPFRAVQAPKAKSSSKEAADQKMDEIMRENSQVKTSFKGVSFSANPQVWGYANQLLTGLYNTNVPRKAGAAEGEVKDANGIITTPAEGEHKFYTREGTAYYVSGNQVYYAAQSGDVEIVETADGTIYIKDIVSRYTQNTWVKGTKEGNTITIAAGQPIAYNTNYATTLSVNWGNYDENTEYGWNKVDGDITFAVDAAANTISLVGSSETLYVGVFWDDDNSFSGYGDYESVYTLDENYEPTSTDPIVPPAGLVTETWNVKYDVVTSSAVTPTVGTATVGFVGNEVYVQGLFNNFPTAWIKGTIEGSNVTFSNLQYLGIFNGSYDIWMVGATYDEAANNYSLDDFKMTYDADNKVLTAVNDVLANAANDRFYYLQWISNLTIQEEAFEEEAVQTGEPVDVLPYINNFENEATEPQFGVIDGNNDTYVWTAYDDNGVSTYRLRWNSSKAADDWLVSPAIKLEAGKAYHFSILTRAQSTNYPERIEVKLASEAKASVLAEGAPVIYPTVVDWADYQKLENEFVSVEETGFYHFGIHGISDADTYYIFVTEFVVEAGADANAPDAVSNLTVTPKDGVLGADITFSAPAKAVSGADLTSNLEKIEILRDENVIKTFENVAPGSAVAYEDVAEDLTIGDHTYQVVAYNEAGAGKKSEIISVRLVTYLPLPYYADFTIQSTMTLFQVIDANADNSTWMWSSSNGAYYKYNSNNVGDDYLVTLPMLVQAGKNYDVKVEVAAQSTNYAERFEVVAGNEASAEGLTVGVIPVTDVTSTEFAEYAGTFTAQADGIMYVAIHAISDPDMFYLNVRSLSIESIDPLAPAAPEVTVTPDAQGGLTAEVQVVAPTTSVNGEALTANVRIDVMRDGVIVKTFESVAPGATLSFTDTVEADATYTYQAIASNAYGSGKSSEAEGEFIGLDIPVAPANFAANDAANSILFSWDALTEGANGGYVLPVKYNLYDATVESSSYGSYLVLAEEPFAAGVEGTSVNREYNVDEGEQGYTYFAIKAENSKGESADYNYTAIHAGAPYELPVIEGFAGNSLHYFWTYENTQLFISGESSDGDGTALMLVNMEDATSPSAFISGKLNLTNATNPTLVFDVKTEAQASKLFIIGHKAAQEYQVLSNYIPMVKEYTTVKVPLKDIVDERFSQIAFYAQMPNLTTEELDWSTFQYVYNFGDSIILDNIRIVDLLKYDVQMKDIAAPTKVNAGEDINLTYTVENIGEETANDVIVEVFYKDNNENTDEIVLKADTISLTSFESKEFNLVAPTSVFTGTEAEFRVVATFTNDLNVDNNEIGTTVTVKQSTLPAPTDVVLETASLTNANSATISWTAPEPINTMLAAAAVTEDFEDQSIFAPGSTGGVDATVHTGAFGDWTLYDGNGITVYGWQNYTVPGIGDPSAWVVMNPAQVNEQFAAYYTPNSGEQVLISMCPADNSGTPAADHWLISPALSGAAQTVSFFAREITTSYGDETFEVLASSTNNEPASFTRVASLSSASAEWEEFTADLPAGTKYFAIRHTAQDIFGLLIDDITYIPAGGAAPAVSSTVLTGYNIYVDHDFTVNAKASQTETTFPHRFKGTEKIFLTAVYNLIDEAQPLKAEQVESAPVQAIGNVTGIEELLVKSGKNVNVYTMDGKLIRSNNGLRKGVYVVDGKKVVK